MLTEHRNISLCYLSTNLEILVHLDTIATLYQRGDDTFHVVLNNVELCKISKTQDRLNESNLSKNLIWLEISPFRVIMTQQNNNGLNYRHYWEKGVYGKSRYWLNDDPQDNSQGHNLSLRNFTRNLTFKGRSNPRSLRIEYELWSNHLNLGHYILHLEIN